VTLFTDTLSWDHAQGTIYTDDSVMIITEKQEGPLCLNAYP